MHYIACNWTTKYSKKKPESLEFNRPHCPIGYSIWVNCNLLTESQSFLGRYLSSTPVQISIISPLFELSPRDEAGILAVIETAYTSVHIFISKICLHQPAEKFYPQRACRPIEVPLRFIMHDILWVSELLNLSACSLLPTFFLKKLVLHALVVYQRSTLPIFSKYLVWLVSLWVACGVW